MPTIIAGWLGTIGIGAGVASVAGYVIAGLGLSLVAQKSSIDADNVVRIEVRVVIFVPDSNASSPSI